jgi:hypothetical protein
VFLCVVESRETVFSVVDILCVSLCSGEQSDCFSVVVILYVSLCSGEQSDCL